MKRKKEKIKSSHSYLSTYILIVTAIVLVFIGVKIVDFKRQQWLLQYKQEDFVLTPNYLIKINTATIEAKLRVPILLYHYVEYVKDQKDTLRKRQNINPYIFEKQLQSLKEASYEAVFIRDVGLALDQRKRLPENPYVLTFDDSYEDFYTDVFPLLKKYNIKATLYVITDFLDTTHNFLKKEQIIELSKTGLVEIAGHTSHHLYLKDLNPILAETEINLGKKNLEEIIGKRIYSFAYPYGAFDDQAIELVKKAGYQTATSVIAGIEHSKTSRFFMFRLRPGERTGKELIGWLDQYP